MKRNESPIRVPCDLEETRRGPGQHAHAPGTAAGVVAGPGAGEGVAPGDPWLLSPDWAAGPTRTDVATDVAHMRGRPTRQPRATRARDRCAVRTDLGPGLTAPSSQDPQPRSQCHVDFTSWVRKSFPPVPSPTSGEKATSHTRLLTLLPHGSDWVPSRRPRGRPAATIRSRRREEGTDGRTDGGRTAPPGMRTGREPAPPARTRLRVWRVLGWRGWWSQPAQPPESPRPPLSSR